MQAAYYAKARTILLFYGNFANLQGFGTVFHANVYILEIIGRGLDVRDGGIFAT